MVSRGFCLLVFAMASCSCAHAAAVRPIVTFSAGESDRHVVMLSEAKLESHAFARLEDAVEAACALRGSGSGPVVLNVASGRCVEGKPVGGGLA